MEDRAAVISAVFREVFGEEFDPEDSGHRAMMQRAAFLLREMGVDVGRYCFFWQDDSGA